MLGATLQIARGHGEDRFYSPAMARRSYLHHHHNLQRSRSCGSAGVSSVPALVFKGNTAFPVVHVPEDRTGSGEEPSGPVAAPTASSSSGGTPSSATSSSSCSSLESENAPSCNLGRFVESTTPSVPDQNHSKSTMRGWRTCDADYRSYYALGDLWDSFKEWSAYGAAVPLVLDGGDRVVQYYVPYLSGIQLYGRSTAQAVSSRRLGEESNGDCYRDFSSDGSSDYETEKQLKLKTCAQNTSVININKFPLRENDVDMTDEFSSEDNEVGSPEGTLLFEYLEHDPPYSREPLANKVSALACHFPGLKTLRSCDLLPSSWISVAWYPIYRIPTGSTLRDLDACFLTFHSLWTPMKDGGNTPDLAIRYGQGSDGISKISLPVFGLASYKLRGSVWTSNAGCDRQLESSLLQAADNWLQLLGVHLPDYQFFASHGAYRR